VTAEKTTPIDADTIGIKDTADSDAIKKVTMLNLYNYIKGELFDEAASTSPADADLVPLQQSGVEKTVALSDLKAYCGGYAGVELTTLDRTLALTDLNKVILMQSGDTLTIDNTVSSAPVGSEVVVVNWNTGGTAVTVTAGGSQVLYGVSGGTDVPATQYSSVRIIKVDTIQWLVIGGV